MALAALHVRVAPLFGMRYRARHFKGYRICVKFSQQRLEISQKPFSHDAGVSEIKQFNFTSDSTPYPICGAHNTLHAHDPLSGFEGRYVGGKEESYGCQFELRIVVQ